MGVFFILRKNFLAEARLVVDYDNKQAICHSYSFLEKYDHNVRMNHMSITKYLILSFPLLRQACGMYPLSSFYITRSFPLSH